MCVGVFWAVFTSYKGYHGTCVRSVWRRYVFYCFVPNDLVSLCWWISFSLHWSSLQCVISYLFTYGQHTQMHRIHINTFAQTDKHKECTNIHLWKRTLSTCYFTNEMQPMLCVVSQNIMPILCYGQCLTISIVFQGPWNIVWSHW